MGARDSEGNRLFTSAEFLTSQQVASPFSRLAAKRRLPDVTSGSDKEADDAERERVQRYCVLLRGDRVVVY